MGHSTGYSMTKDEAINFIREWDALNAEVAALGKKVIIDRCNPSDVRDEFRAKMVQLNNMKYKKIDADYVVTFL